MQQITTDVKTTTTFIDNTPSPSPTDLSMKSDEKSYIIEANNARQSVIFGPIAKKDSSEKNLTIENEYVHKIRKANLLAKQKDIDLPPMDERKVVQLLQKSTSDVSVPSNNVEVFKKILYENVIGDKKEDGVSQDGPEMHWRRKMKLNINW